jgi:DNA-binding transcriptional MerR regulator
MPTLAPTTEKRFFTITEVADRLDVNASTLRYWEREFKQLKPRTNARGKRFYIQRDVELIERIQNLVKTQGFTCKGARAMLKSKASTNTDAVFEKPRPSDNEELLGRLQALRERVLALRA